MKRTSKNFMFKMLFSLAMIVLLTAIPQALANGENSTPTLTSDMIAMVETLENEGQIVNASTVRALTMHLTAVNHYEQQGETDKVLTHMDSFKLLLDHQADNELITENAHRALIDATDSLIQKLSGNDGVNIVEDGQANAVIVVPDFSGQENSDDAKVTTKAAGALNEYIRKSTGTELPVVTLTELRQNEAAYDGLARIYIGHYDEIDANYFSNMLEGMDDQGFIIYPREETVTITGPSIWGTLHGVYEFLERYVGVRWLFPGPDGEDVPLQTNLSVTREVVKEEPSSAYRFISSGLAPEWLQWLQRNKLQRGENRGVYEEGDVSSPSLDRGNIRPVDFMHNLWALFPVEKYGQSNPEFYPNNKPPAAGVTTGWQPCFSEEGTIDAAVTGILEYFAQNPNATSYSLGVNDSRGYCEADPNHPLFPEKTNSIGIPDMSDIYYAWVNEVVTRVLEVYPDKWFGLLAYGNVMDPPSFQVHPRVVPFLTKDRMSWIDDEIRAIGHQQMEDWNEKAAQVAWYDYLYGVMYNVPRVYPHLMAELYQYADDMNVYGHNAEMYQNVGEGPKVWVSARLQWNPDQDVDALLQEWYERAVGPEAAADLAAYYEIWEHFWTERVQESSWFQSGKGSTYLEFINSSYLDLVTDEDIAESRRLLESVVAKAGTEQQKRRAEILLDSFAYYEASALSYPRSTAKPDNEAEALNLLNKTASSIDLKVQLAQKRFDLVNEFQNDPALRFPSSPRGVWSGWNPYEFWHLANYMAENESEGGPLTNAVHQMVENEEPSAQRNFAELLNGVVTGSLPSLSINPSFEEGNSDAEGWIFWNPNRTAVIERTEETANNGSGSIQFTNADRAGVYQLFEVKPGLTAAQVHYYSPEGTESSGGVRLVITLRNDAGRTLGDYISPLMPLTETAGEWASIGLLEEIPYEINGEVVSEVLVNAQVHNAPDAQVYLDDAVVYQIEAPQQEVPEEDPSLTKNHSFEQGVNTAPPWSFYIPANYTGTLKRVEGIARTGNASILADSLQRGGPFQIFDLEPGNAEVEVHYYSPEGTENGTIQLGFYLRNEQRQNLVSYHTLRTPLSETAGSWASLKLEKEVPAVVDGQEIVAGYVVVTIDSAQGEMVYVDDFTVYLNQD